MVGNQPDPPRRERPGMVDRDLGDCHPARRTLDEQVPFMPAKSRLSRCRHGAMRNACRPSQARNQCRLPTGPRGLRRNPSIRAAVRRPAGWPSARAVLPWLTCLRRFRADGLLFRASRLQAQAGTRPARRRYCPGDGFLRRPAGTRFPFPVPRPHERRAGLVRAAGPLVAAATITSRQVAIDSGGSGRPTSGYERSAPSGK